MTAKYTTFLSEQLLRGHVRGLSAWLCTCWQSLVTQHQPETSVALPAGSGEESGCVSVSETRQERDVWRDSAECRAGSCQRLLQQECSTSYRKEGEHQRPQEGRTCIYLIWALAKEILDAFYQQE